MGKTVGIIVGVIALAIVAWLGFMLIDVDQTQEGELPSVDVDVEADGGELPEYDADVGEVVVGTTEETVDVPDVDVDVDMEETEVDVPVIGIETPEEQEEEDEEQ